MVTVGALVAFLFLHASVVGYARRTAALGPRDVVVPLVGALIILAVLVEASRLALAIAAGWLVVGLVVMVARPGAARALGPGGTAAPGGLSGTGGADLTRRRASVTPTIDGDRVRPDGPGARRTEPA